MSSGQLHDQGKAHRPRRSSPTQADAESARCGTQASMPRSLFNECSLLDVTSERFPGKRFMVRRNPIVAASRTCKCAEMLVVTEVESGQYHCRVLLGAESAGERACLPRAVGTSRNASKLQGVSLLPLPPPA